MPVVTEVYRIYNDWVNDFAASMPGRWYATACVPIHDANVAGEEIRRLKDHEFIRGADLMISPLSQPLYRRDGYWDPVWSACVDTGISVSFHIGGSRIPIQELDNMETKIWASNYNQNELGFQAVRGSMGMYSMVQHMISLIFSGALDKYPTLKFVMAESGTGWIPFANTRMDHIFDDAMLQGKLQDPPMTMKPSEYWFRNGLTTFQEEESAGAMAHLVGIDNVMWGSDYPHPDSVWPDSLEKIEEALGNLDEQSRKKIVRDNAMDLYNIGSPRRK
jgi:predicted TIM-barrel fold metal-dependent hydrolase